MKARKCDDAGLAAILVVLIILPSLGLCTTINQHRTGKTQRYHAPISSRLRFTNATTVEGIEAKHEDCPVHIDRALLHHHVLNVVQLQQRTKKRGVSPSFTVNWFAVRYRTSAPEELVSVVERVTEIWSEILEDVVVPITVDIYWSPLAANVLGSAGPSFVYLYSGDGLYYCDAQINQIAGNDVDPTTPDIIVTLNSEFAGWHLDTESDPPPGKHDLVTVLLHELFHGIGMIGLVSSNGQYLTGTSSATYVYDTFLFDQFNAPVVTAATKASSSLMLSRVTSERVYFRIDRDDAQLVYNPEDHARVYAPSQFSPGSSLYHFDEQQYAPGSHLALMTPQLNSQERVLDIGYLGYDVLNTLGWNVRNCSDYSSNCHVCTMASCSWCGEGRCVSTPTSGDECIALEAQCSQCESDAECDDAQDKCRVGTCVANQCVYEARVCDDGLECTASLCDSTLGCVHLDVDGQCHLEDHCSVLRDNSVWRVRVEQLEDAVDSCYILRDELGEMRPPASIHEHTIRRATVHVDIMSGEEGSHVSMSVMCGGLSTVQLVMGQYVNGHYTALFDDEAAESVMAGGQRPLQSLIGAFYGQQVQAGHFCELCITHSGGGTLTVNEVELRIETEDPVDLEHSLLANNEQTACALCSGVTPHDLLYVANIPLEASWTAGVDFPPIPANFFRLGSESIEDQELTLSWCNNDGVPRHALLSRASTDILLQYGEEDSANIYRGTVESFHLCSTSSLRLKDGSFWSYEAQIVNAGSSQSLLTLNATTCEQGYAELELFGQMSFTFRNDDNELRSFDTHTPGMPLFYHRALRWKRIDHGHRLLFFLAAAV